MLDPKKAQNLLFKIITNHFKPKLWTISVAARFSRNLNNKFTKNLLDFFQGFPACAIITATASIITTKTEEIFTAF